jgi:hypothetical protein
MKKHTISTVSAAVFVVFAALSGMPQMANAALPEPGLYEIIPERTFNSEHENAFVIVHRRPAPDKKYGLVFILTGAANTGGSLLCDYAKADNPSGSLSCSMDVQKNGQRLKETLTVGTLNPDSNFCKTLRNSEIKKNGKNVIIKPDECSMNKTCLCYDLTHEYFDSASEKYEDPTEDQIAIMIPPGRGAGSGSTN